jgi:hypothetical protein
MSDRIAPKNGWRSILNGERHMTPHVEMLKRTHRQLDDEIRVEQKGAAPDRVRVDRLKKRKLAVKDRLHCLVDLYEQGKI